MSRKLLGFRGSAGRRGRPGALALAKKNRRAISQISEFHYVECLASSTITSTTAGAVIYLSGVAAGPDPDERTGKKITSKDFKCWIHINGDIASRLLRLVLFRDMDNAGALPTVTQVLTGATYQSFYNPNNRDRFSILKDRTLSLSATDAEKDSHAVVKFRIRRPMAIKYIDDSNAVTSAGAGNLFLLVISETAGTASKIHVRADIRYRA